MKRTYTISLAESKTKHLPPYQEKAKRKTCSEPAFEYLVVGEKIHSFPPRVEGVLLAQLSSTPLTRSSKDLGSGQNVPTLPPWLRWDSDSIPPFPTSTPVVWGTQTWTPHEAPAPVCNCQWEGGSICLILGLSIKIRHEPPFPTQLYHW